MTPSRFAVLAAVLLCGLGSLVALQSAAYDGTLAARVLDPGAKPLPGVTVVILQSAGSEWARLVTDQRGDTPLRSLPPGEYRVTCELRDFEPDYTALVRVQQGRRSRITLTMSPMPPFLDTPVTGEPVPPQATPTRAPQ